MICQLAPCVSPLRRLILQAVLQLYCTFYFLQMDFLRTDICKNRGQRWSEKKSEEANLSTNLETPKHIIWPGHIYYVLQWLFRSRSNDPFWCRCLYLAPTIWCSLATIVVEDQGQSRSTKIKKMSTKVNQGQNQNNKIHVNHNTKLFP